MSLTVPYRWRSTSMGLARLAALLGLALFATVPQPARAAGYSDMIIDVNSGKIVHETNADEARFPASLAKIMTLYVTFDMIERKRLNLDTDLVISDYDANAQPSKLGLHTGDKIRVSDAIKALVTASANDVARAIAENLGGDEEKFARYMTWQAHKLGMTNTTFRNASGLPDPEQTTTARDYVTLSLRLYDDFPQYFSYFKTTYFAYGRARYRNHNGLLFNFQGSDGIKTGYTHASGFNLAASVHRGGMHVIGVIFGERSVGERNSRMRNLLTAALSHASASHTRVPARLQVQVAEKRTGTNRTVKITQAVAAAPKEFAEPETPVAPSSKAAAVRPASRSATALARPAPAPQAVAEAAEPSPAAGPVNPLPGPFHVQIGAFGSEAEARQRLGTAMGTAGDVLAGHRAAALAFNAPDRIWYRARFAGFDRPAADQTCLALKARHLECIVMRAD